MPILSELLEAKKQLDEADRRAAIKALMEVVRHGLGVIFSAAFTVDNFCKHYNLNKKIVDTVLAEMLNEKLIKIDGLSVNLTALGAEKIC